MSGNSPLAPRLYPKGEAQGGVTFAVLNFREPPLACRAQPERSGAVFEREAERGSVPCEFHASYSPEVNIRSSRDIHFRLTDASQPFSDNLNMAAPEKPLWYLQEWFATQDKIQRTLVTELGWLPAKANKIWHGIQEPKPSEMHEIAALLNIRPHELMMPPEEAFRIRRLEAAVREVAQESAPPAPVADVPAKKGSSRAA